MLSCWKRCFSPPSAAEEQKAASHARQKSSDETLALQMQIDEYEQEVKRQSLEPIASRPNPNRLEVKEVRPTGWESKVSGSTGLDSKSSEGSESRASATLSPPAERPIEQSLAHSDAPEYRSVVAPLTVSGRLAVPHPFPHPSQHSPLSTEKQQPSVLQRLPSFSAGTSTLHQACAICLNDFELRQRVRTLQCLHQFHSSCVDPWLSSYSQLCPVCRHPAID